MAKQDPKEIHFIVRSKNDLSKQMQLVVNTEDSSIGVIQNNGMELLVIASSFSREECISFIGMDVAKGPDRTVITEVGSTTRFGNPNLKERNEL